MRPGRLSFQVATAVTWGRPQPYKRSRTRYPTPSRLEGSLAGTRYVLVVSLTVPASWGTELTIFPWVLGLKVGPRHLCTPSVLSRALSRQFGSLRSGCSFYSLSHTLVYAAHLGHHVDSDANCVEAVPVGLPYAQPVAQPLGMMPACARVILARSALETFRRPSASRAPISKSRHLTPFPWHRKPASHRSPLLCLCQTPARHEHYAESVPLGNQACAHRYDSGICAPRIVRRCIRHENRLIVCVGETVGKAWPVSVPCRPDCFAFSHFGIFRR